MSIVTTDTRAGALILLPLATLCLNGAEAASNSPSTATRIELRGNSASIVGRGASVRGNRVQISAAGTYLLSGKLEAGQLIVDTIDQAPVQLLLQGASIHNPAGPALKVERAELVEIVLAEASDNRLSNGVYSAGAEPAAQQQAAIYSREDLRIRGSGALSIEAQSGHGIESRDSLFVLGGKLTLRAASDGLRTKDSVRIEGGQLSLTAASDGIRTEGKLHFKGGSVSVSAGGGSAQSTRRAQRYDRRGPWQQPQEVSTPVDAVETKGLTAGLAIAVSGGSIRLDTAGNGIDTKGSFAQSGGTVQIAAGNAAIHAEQAIVVTAGTLNITRSYEGLETPALTIKGGETRLVSMDDGTNVVSSAGGGGFGGRRGFVGSGAVFRMEGGYLYIDSGGDGLDCNGNVFMSGGRVVVNGPVYNMNSPLDYDGGFSMTGGMLVAAGSAGMAQAPDASSTQHSVSLTLTAALAGGTAVHFATAAGQPVLTFTPAKEFQSVVVNSPEFRSGETYVAYVNGTVSGNSKDGLLGNGTHRGGTEVARFTVSDVVTYAGVSTRRGWGGMGRF